MKLLALFMLFMFLSAFFIISNENLAMKDKEARMQFARSYYTWFLGVLDNFKSITGSVIRSDWIPDNDIISNKTK